MQNRQSPHPLRHKLKFDKDGNVIHKYPMSDKARNNIIAWLIKTDRFKTIRELSRNDYVKCNDVKELTKYIRKWIIHDIALENNILTTPTIRISLSWIFILWQYVNSKKNPFNKKEFINNYPELLI